METGMVREKAGTGTAGRVACPAFSLGGVTAALAVTLAVFAWVKSEYGPDEFAAPAFTRTYICADPACGDAFNLSADPFDNLRAGPFDELRKKQGQAPPGELPVPLFPPGICPKCGRMTLRRAERCTSCGELVPSPPPDRLLGAKCSKCGKEIFGPLGGRWPENPQRPKNIGNVPE
jgi:hypothetical protein